MPISLRIVDSVIFIESVDPVAFEDLRAAIESIDKDPSWRLGMNVVHDSTRKAQLASLAEAELRIELLLRHSERLAIRRWALVVTEPGQFRMARSAELVTQRSLVAFRPFRDVAAATQWVQEKA